ncbi:hypothetical protein B4168_1143 [Anoxybacillus flavithermus]|nr:hypothetical protein B4168_1143 [Anoxybacillus flavithermus]OAO88214.1 hypothetical protein GT23_0490 [Parageobacillus thermoglucosidasius]
MYSLKVYPILPMIAKHCFGRIEKETSLVNKKHSLPRQL